ncbi:MAG: hypothetical protein WCJ88_04110, partial [Actinomycetes bacterium]
SPTNPGSWTLRAKDGSEVSANRIWILYRYVGPSRELGDWINRAYPIIVVNKQFDGLLLQLRETRSNR